MGQIEQYWQNYLKTLPASPAGLTYDADQFGDSPELADELGQLVLDGVKTATCSALWEWEAEQCPLPKVGDKTIVLDGQKAPLCIIETTEVTIRPFNQVDAQFAYEEGEGDRTLESWQQAHWQYFARALPKIGKTPTPEMAMVCERFRVVYRSPSFLIRDCELDEAVDVLELWKAAAATVSLTDDLDGVRTAIQASATHFLVAVQGTQKDAKIIGSLIGGFDGWRGNLYRLVVHPDARRLGVATRLITEVERRFAQQGVRRITALVEKDHAHAVSFWETVGYDLDVRIARYIHNL